MTPQQKCQILDPTPPYVTASHFFHYIIFPHAIWEKVTHFFYDQRSWKVNLPIFYNWYVNVANYIDKLMNQQHNTGIHQQR